MDYSTSTQMANQMETGIEKMVKKEELNDRYSTFANAGDRKKRSEKVKRSIDSMFRRSVKVEISTAEVENTECQYPAKQFKQITARPHAAIELIPIQVSNSGSTDRPEPAKSTPTLSAATGANERSIWESEPEDHDDGCSEDDGDINETVSSKQRHLKDNANCDVCGKKFTSSGHLKVHERTHTGERTFKCPTCKKRFSQIGNLNMHKVIHTGEKPFKCDVCKKRFTQNEHLKRHKRIHTGERPYNCEICNKGFFGSGDLQRHKRTHTGEKPYKCLTCGHCFTRSFGLQRHKRTHADPDADSQPNVSRDGMDQFSTTDACDPLDNSANGQKIRYKSKSIDYVVEKMASKNPDILYLVWSKKFTMERASAVARSGFNCILCVKKIQPLPFRDVVNLSNGLHTCVAEIGPDSKTLRLFSFGGMFLPEKITNHGRFKSLAKLESKMRKFSRSQGMEMVNIFKYSAKNSGWYRSLRDGLKGDSIITDYI